LRKFVPSAFETGSATQDIAHISPLSKVLLQHFCTFSHRPKIFLLYVF